MAFLFGGGKADTPQSNSQLKVTGVQVQTSVYGSTIPVVYGQTRIAGNLIWLGDFKSKTREIEQEGGKGGPAGGGGKGGPTQTETTYSASFMMALCHGEIESLVKVWINKGSQEGGSARLGYATGAQGQAVWGHLTTNHPSKALGYSGIAHVRAANYQLGSSANLPQWNFEIKRASGVPGHVDANPAAIALDLLTSSVYGAGFPSALIDFDDYSTYCLAAGLLLSPAFREQVAAGELLDRLAELTNSAVVWTGMELRIVPYGDEALTGNGATYTPPQESLFDLDDDDFLDLEDPVRLVRKRPADAYNKVVLEWSNRSKRYNLETIEASDSAAIELYGERSEGTIDGQAICTQAVAKFAAQAKLQRYTFRNEYEFEVGWRYCMLECMDIVTITDAGLGLDRQWVRIVEMSEDDEGRIRVRAEEYLRGTGHPAAYDYENADGYFGDQETPPGDANPPVFIDPPGRLVGARPEVWIALSGGEDWGGCDIYVSPDDETYKFVGRHMMRSRHGVLTAQLPSGDPVDTVNTLSVNLSVSDGALYSGTQDDADNLVTLCWVSGEWLAYQTATLTDPNEYDLTYLVRGAYGSPIQSHAAGNDFVRADERLYRYPYPPELMGRPFYLKFVSCNIYGLGAQDISEVDSYLHIPGDYVVPAVTGLQVVGGGTEFTGSDCPVEWTAVPGAARYRVEVLSTGDEAKREEILLGTQYVYDVERNRTDFTTPARSFKLMVTAVDQFGVESDPATITVSNPAPSMAGFTPTITVKLGMVSADWSGWTPSPDTVAYRVYLDASSPPQTLVATVPAPADGHRVRVRVPRGAVWYLRVVPLDHMGAGTTSTGISTTGQAIEWEDVSDPRSGDGKNRLPLRYSTFENRKLPPLAVSNVTATLETALSAFDTRSLKTTATSAGGHCTLAASAGAYNVRLAAGKKWLLSAYANAPSANTQVRLAVVTPDGTYQSDVITITAADTWTRISAVLDLSSDTKAGLNVRLIHAGTTTVYWDAIMLEQYVGDGTNVAPSPYTFGQSSLGAISTEAIEEGAFTETYVDVVADYNLVDAYTYYTIAGPSGDFDLRSGDIVELTGKVQDVEGGCRLRFYYSDNGGSSWTALGYITIHGADDGGVLVATQTISSTVSRRYRLMGYSLSLTNNLVSGIEFAARVTKR